MLSLAMHDAMRAICQGRGQGATRSGILMMNNGLILTGGTPALPNSIGARSSLEPSRRFSRYLFTCEHSAAVYPVYFRCWLPCIGGRNQTRDITTDRRHPTLQQAASAAPRR